MLNLGAVAHVPMWAMLLICAAEAFGGYLIGRVDGRRKRRKPWEIN